MEQYHALERKHFFYFVTCCKTWMKFLGISDWDVRFYFQEGDEQDPRACMGVESYGNRLAMIIVFDMWDAPPSPRNLWIVAFHEVHELLLADCHIMAQSREWNDESYDREHHRVIRMLENSVFLDMWEGKNAIFNIQSTDEVPEYTGSEVPDVYPVEEVPDS